MESKNFTLDLPTREPISAVAPSAPTPNRAKADSNTSSIASFHENNSPTDNNPTSLSQEEQHERSELELRAQYPPGDARAMSPRRSSAETDQMLNNAQIAIHRYLVTAGNRL